MRSVASRYLSHSALISSRTRLHFPVVLLGWFCIILQKNLLHKFQFTGSTISSMSATLRLAAKESVTTVLQYLPSTSSNVPKQGLESAANRSPTLEPTIMVQARRV